jgi:hypothetical protein
MKKKANNQVSWEKQLSVDFRTEQSTKSSREIRVIYFDKRQRHNSELNILKDIVQNTQSY